MAIASQESKRKPPGALFHYLTGSMLACVHGRFDPFLSHICAHELDHELQWYSCVLCDDVVGR